MKYRGKINENTKATLGVLINFGEILYLLKTHSNICNGSEECSVEVSASSFASDYLGDVLKYQSRHKGYSLGVLINFGEILDLLKIHSNIRCGSEECSVEVSVTYFASD